MMTESIVEKEPAAARLLLALLLAAAAIGCAGCVPAVYSPVEYIEPEVSDYDFLSEYGEWISLPHYGLVWRPYVVADWAPFYHGHWVWTDEGWAWVSYEPFGMLVYHYGYWDYSLRFGWVWIPDDVWSPARVEWYTYGDYCAWAPMPPSRMRWHDPWDPWDVDVWIVVHVEHFTDENVGRHRLRERSRSEIVEHGTAVKRPPTVGRVETAKKEQIRKIPIERVRVPIDREVMKTRSKPGRPGKGPLRKMVLPDQERKKIDEHAPKVKREILTPKKTEPEKKQERNDTRKVSREKEQKQQEQRKQEQQKQEQKQQEKKKDRDRR